MTDTQQKKGVWDLQDVRDKQLAGEWSYYLAPVKGYLYTWGTNQDGQLALNDRTNRSSPTQVGTNTTWGFLCRGQDGFHHTGAIKTDGTLWMWGQNTDGELGFNSRADHRSSPAQLGTDSTWARLVTGGKENCMATKTDGTLWAWGSNASGGLGQNQNYTHVRSSPVQIGTGTDWGTETAKISSGFYTNFAIKTDGTLWSWGYNSDGQVGQNQGGGFISSPTQIPGTTWDKLAVQNYNHTAAIKTNGTLWTWGEGQYGQLGNNQNENNTRRYSSPIQVPGTTWASITAHASCMYAVKTDGTLWTWGRNHEGQLGINLGSPTTSRSSPTQVGTDTTWSTDPVHITGAYESNISLLKTDGTLWSWGSNANGSQGLNDRTARSSPTQVGTATEWAAIAAAGVGGRTAIEWNI